MRIVLSVALSSDWCLDDCSAERLVLSNDKDWQEVYDLRGERDAILVGAGTLRSDNPSLRIKSDDVRARRESAGLSPEICRVTLTRSGNLEPSLKFFSPDGECVVFTTVKLPGVLEESSRVICRKNLTARVIAYELERMGKESLLVEGGAQILKMFLSEGVFDELRVAVSPKVVGEDAAPHLVEPSKLYSMTVERDYMLDDMHITWYRNSGADGLFDYKTMLRAIELSTRCEQNSTHYCVGAVIVTADGQTFEGYTGETGEHDHAEEAAVSKADAADVSLKGATIYTSMEPCSTRKSKPCSCSQMLIERGFRRVVFAASEPDRFVRCVGEATLRENGLEVLQLSELADDAAAVNAYLNL